MGAFIRIGSSCCDLFSVFCDLAGRFYDFYYNYTINNDINTRE